MKRMHLLLNTSTYILYGYSKEHKYCYWHRTCKTTVVEMLSSIVYACKCFLSDNG